MKNIGYGILNVAVATLFFSSQSFAANISELCAKGLLGDEDCKLVVGAAAAAAAGGATVAITHPQIQKAAAEEQAQRVQQSKLSNAMSEANESKLRLYLRQNAGDGKAEVDIIPVSRSKPHQAGSPEFDQAYRVMGNDADSYKMDVVLKGEMARHEAARQVMVEVKDLEAQLTQNHSDIIEENAAIQKLQEQRQLLAQQTEAAQKYLNLSKNRFAPLHVGDAISTVRSQLTKLDQITKIGDELTPEQTKTYQKLSALRSYLTNLPRKNMTEGSLVLELQSSLDNVDKMIKHNQEVLEKLTEKSHSLPTDIAGKRQLAEQYSSGQMDPKGNIRSSYYKVGDRLFQVVDNKGTLEEIDAKSTAYIERMKTSGSEPTALIKFNSKNSRSLATQVRARSAGMIIGSIGLGILMEEISVGGYRSYNSEIVSKVQPAQFNAASVNTAK